MFSLGAHSGHRSERGPPGGLKWRLGSTGTDGSRQSGLGDYNETTPTRDSLAFIIHTRIVCVFLAGE